MTASALLGRLRRPRTLVLLGLLVVLIALRVALPGIVRDVAVSQADAALVGRIELADVDLSLLRGGVTLHDVEVYADELPVPADGAAAEPPGEPLARIGRLWVRIGWLPLLRKTLDVAEVELEHFAVRLDRAQDGALVLPRPVPAETPPEPEPPPDEDGGWAVRVTSVRLRDGLVGFRDFAADPEPKPFEVAIEDVTADNLSLTIGDPAQEPGRLRLQAKIGDGRFGLDAQVAMRAAGPRAESTIELRDLPIQGTRVYLKALGWTETTGLLDADLKHTFEAGGEHRASGTLALRDLVVTVPGLERPALAWRRLDVAIEAVDVAARAAEVASVVLDGLRVPLRPNEPGRPFPVLQAVLADEAEPAAETAAPPPDAPAGGAAWTWRVSEVRLADAALELLRGGDATPVGVAAEVRGASSDPGARTEVALHVTPPEGTLDVAGTVVQQPLSFDGTVRVAALSLPRLLAPIEQPAAALVRGGVLDADLSVAAGPPSEAGERAARVRGTIALAGVDLGEPPPAGDAFGVAWKSLALDVREVVVPAALGGEAAGPIRAALERVALVEPKVRVTRTESGVVLPAAIAGADADRAAPVASPTPAPAPTPAVDVRITRASLERGRVQVEDRAVRPAYRNVIEPLDLRASGVRWPGPAIEQLRLDARTTGGAKLAVTGSLRAGAADVTAKVDALPLAPLSPYAAGTGYGVAGGSASLDAKLSMKGDAYDASSRLVLSQLAVSGEQGEALFQQQFGIPLSLALALLTDLEGNITLDVPVTGDRRGTSVGIGSLVGQALTKAILGAITSPLKMIMAVATADGKVTSATPQSIRFRPGRAQLAQGGEELLAQLAALLGRSPGLRIELTGRAGAEDERWLREQSLRAEIERSSGFLGSVLNVGELGEREAVLPVLEKRAADEPADVPAEAQEWFDRRVAEQALAPGRIGELAAARAELVRTTLVEQHGIATERIARAPADASATGAQAPEVALTLGAAQR